MSLSPEGPPDFYDIPPHQPNSPEPPAPSKTSTENLLDSVEGILQRSEHQVDPSPQVEPERKKRNPIEDELDAVEATLRRREEQGLAAQIEPEPRAKPEIEKELDAVKATIKRREQEQSASSKTELQSLRVDREDESRDQVEETLRGSDYVETSRLERAWSDVELRLDRLGDHLSFILQDVQEALVMLNKAREADALSKTSTSRPQEEVLQELQSLTEKMPVLQDLETRLTGLQVLLVGAGGGVNEKEFNEAIQRMKETGQYGFVSRKVEPGALIRSSGERVDRLLSDEESALAAARDALNPSGAETR